MINYSYSCSLVPQPVIKAHQFAGPQEWQVRYFSDAIKILTAIRF